MREVNNLRVRNTNHDPNVRMWEEYFRKKNIKNYYKNNYKIYKKKIFIIIDCK